MVHRDRILGHQPHVKIRAPTSPPPATLAAHNKRTKRRANMHGMQRRTAVCISRSDLLHHGLPRIISCGHHSARAGRCAWRFRPSRRAPAAMPCRINVRVVEARDLPVMDRATSSTDAYVVVKLPGADTAWSSSVCRKSLDPRWNESVSRNIPDDQCVLPLGARSCAAGAILLTMAPALPPLLQGVTG